MISLDALQLKRIRERVGALSRTEWFLAADGATPIVEAKAGEGAPVEIVRFHRGATPEEIDLIANAATDLAFLLRLVDRAIADARRRSAPPKIDPKDFAAEAAMKCAEYDFMLFLEERHGLEPPVSADSAAEKLRSVLCVSSRRELNTDQAAADRWRNLRADYDAWRKRSPMTQHRSQRGAA